MTKEKLNVQTWLQAGFRALTKGGPQAIRAEAIARDLQVSKGSFYWHFKNVDDLKTQMLSHWKTQATDNIIAALEQETGTAPADKLRMLFNIATGDANAPYGGVLAESAIRDWARYTPTVADAVQTVDRERLGYVSDLLAQCPPSGRDHKQQAVILYGALIGLEALAHNGLCDVRRDLNQLLETILGSHPDSA